MTMTLLHAIAVVLTVLLLAVRHRCALQGVYSSRILPRPSIQKSGPMKPVTRANLMCDGVGDAACNEEMDVLLTDPKYKRDPEIDVDHEDIGYYPMG